VIDLGIDTHLRAGTLVPVLTDWPDETYPLYVYYPSRNHVPAKVRAFIDFVAGMMPGPQSEGRGLPAAAKRSLEIKQAAL
jgi:DNA-binding transcriptional LysR family regulator